MSIQVPELGSRERGRNVYIYSDKDLSTILGGLVATPSITNSDLYSMIEIILKLSKEYTLYNEAGMAIPRGDQSLRPGKYIIVTAGLLTLSDQPWLPRMSQVTTRPQDIAFVNAVRGRDRGCIITGQPAWHADFGLWYGFKAVHLFPPEFQENWNHYNLVELIGNPEDTINSAHNGILLESQMADLFEGYIISINPDDNYKIVCFQPGWTQISGRSIDIRFINNPARALDHLLRWHYQQAILANVRGRDEPVFDPELPCRWVF